MVLRREISSFYLCEGNVLPTLCSALKHAKEITLYYLVLWSTTMQKSSFKKSFFVLPEVPRRDVLLLGSSFPEFMPSGFLPSMSGLFHQICVSWAFQDQTYVFQVCKATIWSYCLYFFKVLSGGSSGLWCELCHMVLQAVIWMFRFCCLLDNVVLLLLFAMLVHSPPFIVWGCPMVCDFLACTDNWSFHLPVNFHIFGYMTGHGSLLPVFYFFIYWFATKLESHGIGLKGGYTKMYWAVPSEVFASLQLSWRQ